MNQAEIRDMIRQLGGPEAVAKRLKPTNRSKGRGRITAAAVSKWTRIPAERCIELAALSGYRYAPADMRPDVFAVPTKKR